jgi:glycosyltransferase involved in cell wall biosynthesis
MERRPRSSKPAKGDLTEEAAAAFRALAGSDVEPWLVAAHPSFVTNPYQDLLYQRSREHGLAPVRVRRDEQLDELLDIQRAGLPTILHLHWLHLVMKGAGSAKEARKRADDFLGRLDAQHRTGGRIAWTVHNILPHESRFDAEEARLCGEVASRADVVHVMAERTPELVAPFFELPRDRLLVVPHMSYIGAYEDHTSRLDARHELGLMPDELVYLVLGAIRPYKGLPELLDAWAALPPDRPRRLVIAGAPTDEPGVEEVLERAAIATGVLLDARKIPPDEMQVFLRAADIAVLPYRRALNSGALLLALTFGLPAVVPADSGLAESVGAAFGRTFDPDVEASLGEALLGAADLATETARAAATAAAAAVSPEIVSRRFSVGLREAMARPRT